MADRFGDAAPFVPLDDYAPPSLPTDETLRHVVRRLGARLFDVVAEDPLVSEDRLHHTDAATLGRIAGPPASGPVAAGMDATFADWLADPEGPRLQLVVLPPCEEEGIVEGWAARHGLAALGPPPRDALLGSLPAPDLAGEGVLVIPRLEAWILRHRDGLGAVRALLRAVADADRRCLVGCGTHPWAYLSRAVGAATGLPTPLTPPPTDAARLRRWFAASIGPGREFETVRSTATGEDVLAADEDGEPACDVLRTLAARSRGIPWVAWHLWRDALRDTPAAGADDAPLPEADDDRTLWVAGLREVALPRGARTEALAVLHALLLHGAMTPAMLRGTLATADAADVVPALLDADIVTRADGRLRCAPVAYPAVRDALADAGHPLGAI